MNNRSVSTESGAGGAQSGGNASHRSNAGSGGTQPGPPSGSSLGTARSIVNHLLRTSNSPTPSHWEIQTGGPQVSGSENTQDGASGDASMPPVFADLIHQLASLPATEPIPPQVATALANQSVLAQSRRTESSATDAGTLGLAMPGVSTPKPAQKEPVTLASLLAGLSNSAGVKVETSQAAHHSQEAVTAAIDVTTPLPAMRPKLYQNSEAAAQPAPFRAPQTEATAQAREAALTVVIHTGQAQSNQPANEIPGTVTPAQGAAQSAAQTEGADSSAAENDEHADREDFGRVAVSSGVGTSGLASQAIPTLPDNAMPGSNVVQLAVGMAAQISPGGGGRHRGAAGDTTSGSPQNDLPTVAGGTQNNGLQRLDLKAEMSQSSGAAASHGDSRPAEAPKPSTTPATAEEAPARPVRSLSLEFAPDGTRDVRLRLTERAGEVHVSVHSTDPSVTKNLRAGVTDLASVLSEAGYDAKTWTSGRQQKDGRQQQEPAVPLRRSSAAGAANENFDGILQSPGILPI